MNNKKVNNNVTLDTRVIACVGSINFKDNVHDDLPNLISNLEDLISHCNFVENYYLISHDDTNTPHIHYALELTGQKRLKTLLNDFEKLGYNRLSVNIDKLGFLNSTIRYFLHIDDDSREEGKKVYQVESIVSNMPIEYLQDLLDVEDDELNVDRLINICLECNGHKVDIMKRLGIKKYHKYRFEINDILNYEYSLREARDRERKRLIDDSLPF